MDDVGIGDVSSYNAESKVPTPNIDSVAARGVSFDDAHSTSAVCTPSRYSLLTGRYPWRSPLPWSVHAGYEPPLIDGNLLTLPAMLQRAGYRTIAVGKWHLGMDWHRTDGTPVTLDSPLPWDYPTEQFEREIDFAAPLTGGPVDRGFDHFFGCANNPTSMPPYAFIRDRAFVTAPTSYRTPCGPIDPPAGMIAPGYRFDDVDERFVDESLALLDSCRDGTAPFFLYLAPSAAHEPCADEFVPEFARGRSEAGARGDLVWLADWMIGRIDEWLAANGLRDDTVLIVTSDNGALPGVRRLDEAGALALDERGETTWETFGHRSSGDWRGFKSHVWEGGHREPLVVRWPNVIPEGVRRPDLVSLADIFATLADVVGADLDDTDAIDSRSFLPAALNRTSVPEREIDIQESSHGALIVREGSWKCIFGTEGSGGGSPFPPPRDAIPSTGSSRGQLYDLERDPAERENLWDREGDVVARLRRILDEEQSRTTARRRERS